MKRIGHHVQKGFCPECGRYLAGNGYSGMRKHRRQGDKGAVETAWCPGSGKPPLKAHPAQPGSAA